MHELTVANEHATATAILEVWDANEAATPGAATQRLTVVVPPSSTVERSWPPGSGPRFTIGCVASIDGGTGTVNIGGVHCAGALL